MLAIFETSNNRRQTAKEISPHNSEQPPAFEKAVGTVSERGKFHVIPRKEGSEREMTESEEEIGQFEGLTF
jgi:hypothetical protein